MNRNVIIVIVLVVLVLLTAVQAIQLGTLKSQIKSGKLSVASQGGAATGVGTPASIAELPSMVGGC